MTTPVIPAATRLDRDLTAAEAILARLRTATKDATPGEELSARYTHRVPSPARVDALAARFGTRAHWTNWNTQYIAEIGTPGRAVLEIVYFADVKGLAA